MIGIGERIYARQYHRVVQALGNIAHELVDQKEMAEHGATRSTTSSRAAVKVTWKSARTFTTPRTSSATWCWR